MCLVVLGLQKWLAGTSGMAQWYNSCPACVRPWIQSLVLQSPVSSFFWAEEMAQQIRALASKPDELSSILGTYMVARENQVQQVVPSEPRHMY